MKTNSNNTPKIVTNKTLKSVCLIRKKLKKNQKAKNLCERKSIYLMGRIMAFIESNVDRELRDIKKEETQIDWLNEKESFESLLKMIKDFYENQHLLVKNYELMDKYYDNIVSFHDNLSGKVEAKKEMLDH